MSDWIKRFLPFVSLVVLCILIAVLEPRFLSAGNLAGVARQTAVITVIAMGMTVVMVSGGIDLSVGSVMALSGVMGALAMVSGAPVIVGVATAIAAATVCGLLNGAAIAVLRIPPFIVTLGAMGIYRGVALLVTDGKAVVGVPSSFGYLAEGNFLGFVPVPLLIVVSVAMATHFLLVITRPGRYCYAIGSNIEAARYSGIRVSRYQVLFYALLGALTGVAGSIESARLVTGQPTAGEGYELRVIAAVVIGGGSLNGGAGTVLGTTVGAFIMSLLNNGCNLLGISPFLQQILIGGIIILAVAADEF